MPPFNPTAGQSPLAPNFTGASRGIQFDRERPDTSVADLFEGLGEGLLQGVQAVDQGIQAEIQEDVHEGMDQINAEFGIDSAADFEADIWGNQPVPTQLKDSARHLEGLQAARASGQLKESHYWARAQSLVRQLRGRYPGYREQIDTMVEGVTGAPVANSLRRNLMREWGEGAGDNENRRMNQVEEMAKDGSLLVVFPDYNERVAKGDPPTYQELVAGQAEWMQEEALINRGTTRLAAQEAKGELDQAEALRTFKAETLQRRETIMQQAMTKASGESGMTVMEMVQQAHENRQKGIPTTPEEAQQIAAAFENMRMQMGNVFDSILTKAWGDSDSPTASYGASLSSSDIEAARKEFMQPIDRLEKALKGKDTGTLNNFALAMEGRKLKIVNDILTENPGMEFATAMSEALGSDLTAAVIANEPKLKTTIAELSRRVMLNNIMLGDPDDEENFPSMKKDLETVAGDDKISDSDATEITKGTIQSWVNAVETIGTEDELPTEILEKYAAYMFDERNFGALNSLSVEARKQFLSRVSSPRVTEKMLELRKQGKTELWKKYQKWTAHQFKSQFQGDVASIQDRILNPELFDIDWDPENMRFEFALNPDMTPVTRRNITESGEVRMLEKAKNSINRAIQTIAPVIEANDMNPAEQIFLLMTEMGLDTDAAPDEQTVAGGLLNALQRQIMLGAEDIREGDLPLIGRRGAERLGANVRDATEGIRQSFWELVRPFSPQFRTPEERRGVTQEGEAEPEPKVSPELDKRLNELKSEYPDAVKTLQSRPSPPKFDELGFFARRQLASEAKSLGVQPQEIIDRAWELANPKAKKVKGRSILDWAKPGGDPKGTNFGVSPASASPVIFESQHLNIENRVNPNAPYGVSATKNAQPPKYLVMHHAVGDTDNLVAYGHKVDPNRGGSFGYHFYISEEGRVVQAAPLNARTNHVKPKNHPQRKDQTDAENSNSLGITLVNAHDGATMSQLVAAEKLAKELSQTYGIPFENVVGHGELQSDRMSAEGQEILERLRSKNYDTTELPQEDKIRLLELENG